MILVGRAAGGRAACSRGNCAQARTIGRGRARRRQTDSRTVGQSEERVDLRGKRKTKVEANKSIDRPGLECAAQLGQ